MKIDLKIVVQLIAGFSGIVLAVGVAYALRSMTNLSETASGLIGGLIGAVEYYALKLTLLKTLNRRTPR